MTRSASINTPSSARPYEAQAQACTASTPGAATGGNARASRSTSLAQALEASASAGHKHGGSALDGTGAFSGF